MGYEKVFKRKADFFLYAAHRMEDMQTTDHRISNEPT